MVESEATSKGRFSAGMGRIRPRKSTLILIAFLAIAALLNYEPDPRLCSQLSVCKNQGKCAGSPPCQAEGDEMCRASLECRSRGRCREEGGTCVLTSAYCKASTLCKEQGQCVVTR
ncbi:MAG TPA: hypothetical protein VN764_16155, partial [Polyangiaceae bacterium]|nr:hypothetical protein [Polyangiaceae bacterium]